MLDVHVTLPGYWTRCYGHTIAGQKRLERRRLCGCFLGDVQTSYKALVWCGLTPWLTGAGSRRLEGTNIGHENAEGMAYVGVRVEPPVRLGSVVEQFAS